MDLATQERVIDSARRSGLRLAGLVHSLKTYPYDHPSLDASYRGISDALSEIHDLLGTVELSLETEGVRIEGQLADIDSIQHPSLRELLPWMRRRGSTALRVGSAVSVEQMQLLIQQCLLIEDLSPTQACGAINRALAQAGAGHLQLASGGESLAATATHADRAEALLLAYLELATAAEDLLTQGPRPGTLSTIGRTCEQLSRELPQVLAAVPTLLSVGTSFTYEARHVANITVLAIALGARFGLRGSPLNELARAVATMDVGLTLLPVEVRRAGREFTPSESALLHLHPMETVRIHLNERGVDIGLRRRASVAMEHHMGINRDGYPEVLYWPRQHFFSRIAAVCDTYDALTSTTAWRRGLAVPQALAQLASSGGRSYDQSIIAELCAVLGEFPEACAVRLTSGQLAAVVNPRGVDQLPVVRLIGGDQAGLTLDLGLRDAEGRLGQGIREVLCSERTPST